MIYEIPVEKMDPEAYLPYRGSSGAVAHDLTSTEEAVLEPGERRLFRTGLKVAIPAGMAGLVLPRSGLAMRHGVTVLNAPGLVDPDYRGEVGVCLINHGQEPFRVTRGMRIAQLLISHAPEVLFALRATDSTERGDGGWGSTGSSAMHVHSTGI